MPEHLEQAVAKHDKETSMPVLQSMTKSAWAVLEYMLTHPKAPQREIAKHTDLTRGYVCRIQLSPIFKKTLREIRTAAMMDKMAALAEKSIDKASDILDSEESSNRDKIEILKVSMTAMGMGANQGTPAKGESPSVNINLGVTGDMVAEALARKQKKNTVMEGEFTEVKDEQE